MSSLLALTKSKAFSALALAVSVATLVETGIAAPPASTANPFNARAVTNATVSPTNPPTAAQIRRERKVTLVKNLQKLNTANLDQINVQLTDLTAKYEELKDKLDDLDDDDKDRKDIEDELDEIQDQIDQLGGLQTIYQNNYNFLVKFLANLQ